MDKDLRTSVPERISSWARWKRAGSILAVSVLALAGSAVLSANASDAAVIGTVKTPGGRCLENKWGVTTVSNPIQIYDCNGSAAQSWSVEDDGTVRVQTKCIGPLNGAATAGVAVVIANCTGASIQRWSAGDGGTVRHQSSGLCLENRDGVNANENPAVLRACNGGAAQRWSYVGAVVTPPTTAVPTSGAPTTAPTTTAQPVSNPSGVAVPRGNLNGWRQIFYDDFTKDAAVGTFANACDPNKIVYTGAQGQKWRTYPNCYLDTYQKRPYRPDRVLSVKNGVMNFNLHSVDGKPAGANPSPLINGQNQNQTYGRYSARFKVDSANLDEYYVAWLLWPQSEVWPRDGEFDFPEGGLAGNVGGFHHYSGAGSCVGGCQDVARNIGAKFTDWHTYTIEWSPGRVRYLLDDQVVLDSTAFVPSTPMRWQLQTETNGFGTSNGNLMLDWVSVYAYDPAARP
ncbi:hypothetical protein ABH922_001542 [Rhodococcus sp. 27YEA15]|uniref:ricin-type beta-trefoil lectin domain protein n=1 Tax=Rhodococcus sp. 27YEA15 TaxID=3156259 RepID=UPI003C7B3E95